MPVSAQETPAIIHTEEPRTYTPEDSMAIEDLITKANRVRWTIPDSAMRLFNKAVEMSKSLRFTTGVALAYLNMGISQVGQGQYDKAFAYYADAYPYSLQSPIHTSLVPTININIGATYYYMGEYAQSARYYYQAIRYLLQYEPDNINMPITYSNLGAVLNRLGVHDQAFYYLEKAEVLSRRHKMTYPLALTLVNKGEAYIATGDTTSGIRCYEEALAVSRKENFIELQQALYSSQGELLLSKKKIKEAIGYFNKALSVDSNANPYYASIIPYYSLGRAYYLLKDYTNAEMYLTKGISRAEQLGMLDNKADAHRTLAAIYEATGRYPASVNQMHIYLGLKDSLMNKERIQAINQLNIRYQTVQKDKELAEKQLLIARQQHQISGKNTLIGIISLSTLLFTVLSLLLWVLYRNKHHKHRLQEERLRTMEREEEIKLMQALMQGEEKERTRIAQELHDGIGGMLAAIQMHFSASRNRQHDAVPAQHNMDEIMKMLENTADEVRKTAHNLMPDILIKYSFEEALQLYCEHINSGSKLQIDLQIHGTINTLPKSVELSLYRIVQELIQNIIKHAGASQAIIQVNQQETALSIMIEDNGTGFRSGDDYTGIGLQNLRSRVQALQGFLSIESAAGAGTTVYMEFETEKINRTAAAHAAGEIPE